MSAWLGLVVLVVERLFNRVRVLGPTPPKASIPLAIWNFLSAAAVWAPKYPVGAAVR